MAPNKRDDILKSALVLFAERGYDGTTVPMIADNAQVGAGTIYRYFEGKESLVNSLFQQCVAAISEAIDFEEIKSITDVRQQFHYIFQHLVQFAETNIHALLFMEPNNKAHFLDETSNRMFETFLGQFRQILDEGKAKGMIKDLETDAMIAIVFGAFMLLYKLIKSGIIAKTERMLQGVEESCWHAIMRHN